MTVTGTTSAGAASFSGGGLRYGNGGKTHRAACMASRMCRGSCGLHRATALGGLMHRHCNDGGLATAVDMACGMLRYHNSGWMVRAACMAGCLRRGSGTAMACGIFRYHNSGWMVRAACMAGCLRRGSGTAVACGML